jgi:hypothetical protein
VRYVVQSVSHVYGEENTFGAHRDTTTIPLPRGTGIAQTTSFGSHLKTCTRAVTFFLATGSSKPVPECCSQAPSYLRYAAASLQPTSVVLDSSQSKLSDTVPLDMVVYLHWGCCASIKLFPLQ